MHYREGKLCAVLQEPDKAAESDVFILSFINVLDTTNFINEK